MTMTGYIHTKERKECVLKCPMKTAVQKALVVSCHCILCSPSVCHLKGKLPANHNTSYSIWRQPLTITFTHSRHLQSPVNLTSVCLWLYKVKVAAENQYSTVSARYSKFFHLVYLLYIQKVSHVQIKIKKNSTHSR